MQRLVVPTLILVFVMLVGGQFLRSSAEGMHEQQPRPPSAAAAEPSGFAAAETVLERDSSGQFLLEARVNGEEAQFIVDTGADIVALAPAEAERLGIDVAADDYQPILRTASGVGKGAPVRLDRFELGEEELRDVGAVVVEGLGVNLLGQSVLRRLGRVELQGDRMVIEHR